jgi:hypothetical protein
MFSYDQVFGGVISTFGVLSNGASVRERELDYLRTIHVRYMTRRMSLALTCDVSVLVTSQRTRHLVPATSCLCLIQISGP